MVRVGVMGLTATGDTRKIFVSKTVDKSNSALVLVGCKPITMVTVRVRFSVRPFRFARIP